VATEHDLLVGEALSGVGRARVEGGASGARSITRLPARRFRRGVSCGTINPLCSLRYIPYSGAFLLTALALILGLLVSTRLDGTPEEQQTG